VAILQGSVGGAVAQEASAVEYGHVFLDVSSVKGKGLVLTGSPSEQRFLNGMGATQKKGTFICDNIDRLSGKSREFVLGADSRFTWDVTGTQWPVEQTFVMCGTVTILQRYRNEDVAAEFTFAAWGVARSYPGVKQQVPAMTIAYVDFCPQHAQNCETTVEHPEPRMTVRMAHVAGSLQFHDCQSKAHLAGGTVEVVLDTTDEGKQFNASSETKDVCDNVPAKFSNADASVKVDLSTLANIRHYSMDVPIVGRSVPATVYICALVDIHRGLRGETCDTNVTRMRRWRRVPITLEPNETNVQDLGFDYTVPH
jgi:hypothetical protein